MEPIKAGDLVVLDLPNALPMRVLHVVKFDACCRWADSVGQVHERDFHVADLKPCEEPKPHGPVHKEHGHTKKGDK